jgi:hypothetical protein
VDVEVQSSGRLESGGQRKYISLRRIVTTNVFSGVQVYEVNAPISFPFSVCYLSIIMYL